MINTDSMISLIAPFSCLGCGAVGNLLCESCEQASLDAVPSRCFQCHAETLQFSVCMQCRKSLSLRHVWVSSTYTGLAKEVMQKFKFERAQGGGKDVARVLAGSLPILPLGTVVTYIPTSSKRLRVRGYDQSKIVAKYVASAKGFPCQSLIRRHADTRQLGASRAARYRQAAEAFELSAKASIAGKDVLIVDDITTTGASLDAAAKLLKKAGAKSVDAVVFAQAI